MTISWFPRMRLINLNILLLQYTADIYDYSDEMKRSGRKGKKIAN
jgi:hypothetical protein